MQMRFEVNHSRLFVIAAGCNMSLSSDPKYRDYKLPPLLEAALKRFGNWSDDQLRIEEASFRPTAPLFHYTSVDNAQKILRSQSLWCFAHSDQNDKEEFEYSLSLARNELERVARIAGQYAKDFCICVEDLISRNDLTKVFNYFLFSVSQHRDSESQWIEYGRQKTGAAIGFAPGMFIADRLTLSPNANENAHVGVVTYGYKKTIYRHRKVIERAADLTDRVGQANKELLRPDSMHSDYINAMAKEYIARQLIWRSITSKRDDPWEVESEVRYVVMNQAKNFDGGIAKTHTDGRRYIVHAIPLIGNVDEIMVGSAAPDGEEDRLRELLRGLGYAAIPVTRSLK
jgi:hypothetical protein